MIIEPFALERFFAEHEFSARHLLSCSDCESLSMSELVAMGDSDTRRLWDELRLGYTESPGHPLLREAVAELYEGLSRNDVLVVVPEEGIFLSMHALLAPGDHVVCTLPAYQSLHEVARSIGCAVSAWRPVEERGWAFDVDHLEGLIGARTKLVVVNFPHNPTGFLPSRSDFDALIDLVSDRGVHLLSDEMYRFLETGSEATLPAACERYERALSLSGLSKAFGLPGLRIGWLSGRDRSVLQRISMLKDYTTICASAPSEILAIIALRERDAIIAQHRERIGRNLDVLEAFFGDREAQFRWSRPRGGSVCFPRVLFTEDTFALCQDLVARSGIMLAPSRLFGYGDHHVRIGLGRETLPQAIRLLGEHLDRTHGDHGHA